MTEYQAQLFDSLGQRMYNLSKEVHRLPLRIGDTIHCEMEIVALEEKDEERGVIVARNEIKNQSSEEVAVYTTRALEGRKK